MLKLKMLISTVMALGLGCACSPVYAAGPRSSPAPADTTFWIMSGSIVTQGTAPAHPTDGISDHYNASQTAVKTYEIPPVLTHGSRAPYTAPAGAGGPVTRPPTTARPASERFGRRHLGARRRHQRLHRLGPSSRGRRRATRRACRSGRSRSTRSPGGSSPRTPTRRRPLRTPADEDLHLRPQHARSVHLELEPVGGTAAPIKKYAPQTSSGTYSFVNSKLLGGATIDQTAAPPTTRSSSRSTTQPVWRRQQADAISFFSFRSGPRTRSAGWSTFATGHSQSDQRHAPSAARSTTGPRFLGTRYVYKSRSRLAAGTSASTSSACRPRSRLHLQG